MKTVTIKTKFDEIVEYTMIDSEESLAKYLDYVRGVTRNKISSVLKSNVPPSRWDHMTTPDLAGSLLSAGWTDAYVNGGNPLLKMGMHLQAKEDSFVKLIAENEIILINPVGGYCTYNDDYHTILEEKDFQFPTNYVVNKDTKYINLENDPELEQHTIDYLKPIDPNYSYITNLASHNHDALVKIFKEFRSAGGEIVYVYTTGLNVEQMYDYSKAAQEAGLNQFEFEFNSGIDDEIQEFIDDLSETATVTYEGLKP